MQIRNRTVFDLEIHSNNGQNTIQFNGTDFKVERAGAWKTIDYNFKGKDKKGNPIQGRTWVNITNTWYEQDNNDVTVNIKSQPILSATPNQGLIYIMRNASHELDIFKIGLTTRDAETRAKELSRTTGAVDKFLVAQKWDVADCVLAEKMIHNNLDSYRINDSREFFKIDYAAAIKAISEVVEEVNKNFN